MLYAIAEVRAVDAISVTNQEARDFVNRKCFDNLLCRPLSSRMFGHVKVDHDPAVMSQNNEGKQYSEVAVGTVKKSMATMSCK